MLGLLAFQVLFAISTSFFVNCLSLSTVNILVRVFHLYSVRLKHMMGRQRLKTTSHEGDHLSCPYAYQGLQDQLAKGPLGPFTILGDMWCSEQMSHALDIKE